jgi:hypothetical protein
MPVRSSQMGFSVRTAHLACARFGPACVLGDPERASTARGLHTVGTGVRSSYRNLLRSLPETVGFEFCRRPGVRVLIDIIELLRRRRGAQLRHGGGVLRLVLLADVVGYRDGGEYPDNNDDRIVSKPQT